MNYIMGIDLGTSGTKTVLFDETGAVRASRTAEYPLYQPANGWAEQEPEDWWQAVITTVQGVLTDAAINPSQVAGIGISGQMHGLVMLDDAGKPLRKAILWCDGRTTEECAEITRRVGKQALIDITANPALAGFTAGKILWVRRHERELYDRCRHILLPKDYIQYKLTGKIITDISDASGTNLLDVPARRWSQAVLEKLDIAPSLLPDILESCEVAGTVRAAAARLTGLAEGTPVVAGAADNAAAAIGTGIVREENALTTIGTSGVVLTHTNTVRIDPLGRVHTFCAAVPGAWLTMSCTLSAGMSLRWFRDQFCAEEKRIAEATVQDAYALLDQMAAKAPVGAERLLFLPYLMGERSPILDEKARGVFFGLSSVHTKAHMLRAVMEGVAYSQRECFDVLREMGIAPEKMIVCGGGGRSALWRQMLADVYNCPVSTIEGTEGPALGAALLAGVGVGLYSDVASAAERNVRVCTIQQPNAVAVREYKPYYLLYKTLYPALKERFETLAAL